MLDGHAPTVAEQLELLDVAETGALDAPSPLSARSPLADALAPGRRGRKPGSKNRRTEATVRHLLSQGRHPIAVLMEVYSMSVEDLAVRLGQARRREDGTLAMVEGGSLLEVFKLQLRAAEAVAPYLAQKLPQAVQVEAGGGFTLAFAGVSDPARGGAAGAGASASVGWMAPMSDDAGRTDVQDAEWGEEPGLSEA